MPLDVGRVSHLIEQMHRSEDDAGDPIDADKVLVTDGARGFTWEDYGAGASGPAGGDLSGTYPNPSVVDDSHNHTDATVTGTFVPTGILLESDHATPFAFDEIIQASDGSDFLWESA